jgi:hypothetical protein
MELFRLSSTPAHLINNRNSMKKILTLLTTISFLLVACERHPVSHLAAELKEGSAESKQTKAPESTPESSPSGTPKTYFPRSSE